MTTLRLRRASLMCALYALTALAAILTPRSTALGQQGTLPRDSTKRDTSAVKRKRPPDKTFFTRRDAILSAVAVGGTLAIAPFDERIARWAQSPTVQGGTSRHETVDGLTRINETPLTLAALATYGVGRLGRMKAVADVGLHWTEAMALNNAVSEVIRGPIGRARPRVTDNNAFLFHVGRGFTEFDHRSFPSLHASSAFATAAALSAEIGEHQPKAFWYVAPVLYGAALIPGFTRVYLDQHWASDVAAGAFIGTLFGNKVVRYAHSHKRSKLDRILLGTTILPAEGGFVLVLRR